MHCDWSVIITSSSCQCVQEDGESVVDQDIAQEDGAEEEVAESSDREDGLGVSLVAVRASVDQDL